MRATIAAAALLAAAPTVTALAAEPGQPVDSSCRSQAILDCGHSFGQWLKTQQNEGKDPCDTACLLRRLGQAESSLTSLPRCTRSTFEQTRPCVLLKWTETTDGPDRTAFAAELVASTSDIESFVNGNTDPAADGALREAIREAASRIVDLELVAPQGTVVSMKGLGPRPVGDDGRLDYRRVPTDAELKLVNPCLRAGEANELIVKLADYSPEGDQFVRTKRVDVSTKFVPKLTLAIDMRDHSSTLKTVKFPNSQPRDVGPFMGNPGTVCYDDIDKDAAARELMLEFSGTGPLFEGRIVQRAYRPAENKPVTLAGGGIVVYYSHEVIKGQAQEMVKRLVDEFTANPDGFGRDDVLGPFKSPSPVEARAELNKIEGWLGVYAMNESGGAAKWRFIAPGQSADFDQREVVTTLTVGLSKDDKLAELRSAARRLPLLGNALPIETIEIEGDPNPVVYWVSDKKGPTQPGQHLVSAIVNGRGVTAADTLRDIDKLDGTVAKFVRSDGEAVELTMTMTPKLLDAAYLDGIGTEDMPVVMARLRKIFQSDGTPGPLRCSALLNFLWLQTVADDRDSGFAYTDFEKDLTNSCGEELDIKTLHYRKTQNAKSPDATPPNYRLNRADGVRAESRHWIRSAD